MLDWWIHELDTWIVATGALGAMACALLGNYLVLRRMSMMGDAISHAVLPGLVIAFIVTGSRGSLAMLIGALFIGIVTAVLVQTVTKYGNLDEGASMGVIFTALFAVGLILIEQVSHAGNVDLDPGCVLYGALENAPLDTVSVLGRDIPQPFLLNGVMLLINGLFVGLFYKELKISSFDPELSTTVGINATVMHYALMSLVAATTVVAFWSVGSILVIAMLIVPAATAFLLTGRLGIMILLSLVFAALAAFLGHVAAVDIPMRLGIDATSTSGAMAAVSGLMLFVAFILSPREGLAVQLARRAALSHRLACEDILADLYRAHEEALPRGGRLSSDRAHGALAHRIASGWLRLRGLVRESQLTRAGLDRARLVVRAHRLWEGYLVEEAGVESDRVHASAHRLEHVTDPALREELARVTGSPQRDPHDREIPPET